MGVNDLWPLLDPVCKRQSLDDFEGQRVAIDLGFWICESQTAADFDYSYLRNLLFRLIAMLRRKILPIVVADAPTATRLKTHTVRDRLAATGKQLPTSGTTKTTVTRTQFASKIKECRKLVEALGLPFVQSSSEAEATCAQLNADGLVSAVITADNDAFLYGVKVVLRHFALTDDRKNKKLVRQDSDTNKALMVDCYKMDDIEMQLGFERNKMIAFAILCGCDYNEKKGVPGVGPKTALSYVRAFSTGQEALNHLCNGSLSEEPSANEPAVLKKVRKMMDKFTTQGNDFAPHDLINEYMNVCQSIPPLHWNRVDVKLAAELIGDKILHKDTNNQSSAELAMSKCIQVLVAWSLTYPKAVGALQPIRIVKSCVRQFVPMYIVEWKRLSDGYSSISLFALRICRSFSAEDSATSGDVYTTDERQGHVKAAFPEMTREFVTAAELKKPKTQPKRRPAAGPTTAITDFFPTVKRAPTSGSQLPTKTETALSSDVDYDQNDNNITIDIELDSSFVVTDINSIPGFQDGNAASPVSDWNPRMNESFFDPFDDCDEDSGARVTDLMANMTLNQSLSPLKSPVLQPQPNSPSPSISTGLKQDVSPTKTPERPKSSLSVSSDGSWVPLMQRIRPNLERNTLCS